MKHISILAIATAVTIAGSSTIPVQAASQMSVREQLQKNGYAVIGGKTESLKDLNDIVSEVCKELNSFYGKDCSILTLPETDCEKPENSFGENEKPEDTPETDSGSNGVPETDNDSNSAPETDNDSTDNPQELSYAEQVVELVNQERRKARLNPLTLEKEMEAAALVRAKEIEISYNIK